MTKGIRSGLLVSAAAAALLSAAACGTQGADPLGSSSADWNKGNPSVTPGVHHVLPAQFQITDCTLAEYVGILSAFNTAQIGASQLALSVSTNVDVRDLAQKMLTDEQSFSSALAAYMKQTSLAPVESEISLDVSAASQSLLTQLRGDQNFDRDFIVGEIGAHWMISGFLSTVAFAQDFPSNGDRDDRTSREKQFASLVDAAMQAVQIHLGLAFGVESKLVGMCGVAPAVVAPPDAGASSDCGCSGGEGGGSCSNAR